MKIGDARLSTVKRAVRKLLCLAPSRRAAKKIAGMERGFPESCEDFTKWAKVELADEAELEPFLRMCRLFFLPGELGEFHYSRKPTGEGRLRALSGLMGDAEDVVSYLAPYLMLIENEYAAYSFPINGMWVTALARDNTLYGKIWSGENLGDKWHSFYCRDAQKSLAEPIFPGERAAEPEEVERFLDTCGEMSIPVSWGYPLPHMGNDCAEDRFSVRFVKIDNEFVFTRDYSHDYHFAKYPPLISGKYRDTITALQDYFLWLVNGRGFYSFAADENHWIIAIIDKKNELDKAGRPIYEIRGQILNRRLMDDEWRTFAVRLQIGVAGEPDIPPSEYPAEENWLSKFRNHCATLAEPVSWAYGVKPKTSDIAGIAFDYRFVPVQPSGEKSRATMMDKLGELFRRRY